MPTEGPKRWEAYWCPRCNRESPRPWHVCERPSPLIPQNDVETECEAFEVMPVSEHEQEVERLTARVSELEDALRVAADDLAKAANQFAGLLPDGINWRRFEEKAARAEAPLQPDTSESMAGGEPEAEASRAKRQAAAEGRWAAERQLQEVAAKRGESVATVLERARRYDASADTDTSPP